MAAIDQLRSEHNLNNNELAKHRTDDLISKAEILKKQLTRLEEEEKDIKEHRQAKLNLILQFTAGGCSNRKRRKRKSGDERSGRKTEI